MKTLPLDAKDALLVVDMQNDFMEGGSLGISGSKSIIAVINRYIEIFSRNSLAIFASRDFHPVDHSSFRHMGGPWPVHCVAGEFGAEFPVELLLPEDTIIISKAEQPDKDAYSAFDDTCLNNQLEQRGIRRLFIGGLATDYCVLHTVKDALVLGYEAVLLEDAVCAVNQQAGDGDKAKVKMTSLGAVEITLKHIAQ